MALRALAHPTEVTAAVPGRLDDALGEADNLFLHMQKQ
jgi:hypothetical protein